MLALSLLAEQPTNPMANVATHYSNIPAESFGTLVVGNPYSNDNTSSFAGGSIKRPITLPDGTSFLGNFVITGPRLRVCFSGCQWDRIVFAMPGAANPAVYGFERWLRALSETVRAAIWNSPDTYKPGAKSNARFVFDDVIAPASDPIYPDQIRCRLSTHEEPSGRVVDADLFCQEDGMNVAVEPGDIQAGWEIVPVIRVGYHRVGEKFGMTLTLVKGMVFKTERPNNRVNNEDWEMEIVD